MEKSYNQRWKESGTTLTYKEWRRREDEKMASFDGISPKDSIKYDKSFLETKQKLSDVGGYKSDTSNKTTFGIKNYILVLGGLIIVSAIAYKIYKKNK